MALQLSRRPVLGRAQASAPRRCVAVSRSRQTTCVRAQMAGGMSPELKRSIDELIEKNKVVVFMKGTKQAPQVLTLMDATFETVNILEDDRLRSGMKEYSQWPTFPQVYINGEFYGGADIIMEAAQNGQLKEAMEVAALE